MPAKVGRGSCNPRPPGVEIYTRRTAPNAIHVLLAARTTTPTWAPSLVHPPHAKEMYVETGKFAKG